MKEENCAFFAGIIFGTIFTIVFFAICINAGLFWNRGLSEMQYKPKDVVNECDERIEYFQCQKEIAEQVIRSQAKYPGAVQ